MAEKKIDPSHLEQIAAIQDAKLAEAKAVIEAHPKLKELGWSVTARWTPRGIRMIANAPTQLDKRDGSGVT